MIHWQWSMPHERSC